MQQQPFSVAHVEFLSQDEVVEIIATAPLPQVRLLGGVWGPFVPMRPTAAPLWLALLLKRKQRCRIKPPSWLEVAALEAALNAERTSAHCEELPFHFLPVAYQLFAAAPDDVAELERVRSLVEDLRLLRAEKLLRGVLTAKETTEVTKMRGIGSA